MSSQTAQNDEDNGWFWWAGQDDEVVDVGPCATREDAISEAIDSDYFSEFQDDAGTWKISMFVCEARQDPLRLSSWVIGRGLLDDANESLADSDRAGADGDDGPWFDATAQQEEDLINRVKLACDKWQDDHGLVFRCNTFSDIRSRENAIFDHPRTTDNE